MALAAPDAEERPTVKIAEFVPETGILFRIAASDAQGAVAELASALASVGVFPLHA